MTWSIVCAILLPQVLPPDQDRVNRAIARGAGWLLRLPLSSKVPMHPARGFDYDALILFTLVHAGVKKTDPAYLRYLRRVSTAKIASTYRASVTALALNAHGGDEHKRKVFECAQYLVDNMCDNGQWGYGLKYDIPVPRVPKSTGGTTARLRIRRSGRLVATRSGDNSNSQYACLALLACQRSGAEIDRSVVTKAHAWWASSQNRDGSWGYNAGGKKDFKTGGFGSMTTGGASSIVMLQRMLGKSGKTAAVRRAADWLGRNFSVSENPKAPQDRVRFHYYYLYALERMGDIGQLPMMGKHPWYAEGADWLLKKQTGIGSWRGDRSMMPIADTCFAILFLERVTKVYTQSVKRK